MDPKKATNLDPKLKETYERIMNTHVVATPAPQTPVNPTTTQPVQAPQQPVASPQPQPQSANAAPLVTAPPKKTSNLMLVIYILAGVLFFIIYALFWIKFFNLSIPLPF